MTITPNTYMNNICNACGTKLIDNSIHLYSGKQGHLRFARECGYALNNFKKEEQDEILKSSYSIIYIRACFLKPILDGKEWIEKMLKGKNNMI